MSTTYVLAALLLLVVAAAVPSAGWVLMLVAGVSQDAVRKVLPGQTSLLILPAAVIAVAIFGGLWLRGELSRAPRVLGPRSSLRIPVVLFSAWVLVQTGLTVARTGNVPLAALGALGYLLPVVALQLGARVSGDVERTLRWLRLYLVLVAVALLVPLLLRTAGVESPLFDQVRGADDTYVGGVGRVRLEPGLFRTAEIAGWHGALALCVGLYLLLPGAGRARRRGLLVALLAGIAVAVILTGRRKYVVEVVLVLLGFLLVDAVARGRSTERLRSTALVVLGLLVAGAFLWWTRSDDRSLGLQRRLVELSEHSTQRVRGLLLWDAMASTVDRAGWLGFGAGAASQGGRFLGADARTVGYAAEGGVGKILAELGIPGLLLSIWVLFAFVRHVLADLRTLAARGDPRFALVAWAACVLGANVLLFSVAKQVFGNPFILCLLGALAGIVLAAGHWVRGEDARPGGPREGPDVVHIGVRDAEGDG